MNLASIPVNLENKHTQPADLIIVTSKERKLLASSDIRPKVVSVDALMKILATSLLTILTGASGWMVLKIIEDSERITKVESAVNQHQGQQGIMIKKLDDIVTGQRQLMVNQSETRADIRNIKEHLNK